MIHKNKKEAIRQAEILEPVFGENTLLGVMPVFYKDNHYSIIYAHYKVEKIYNKDLKFIMEKDEIIVNEIYVLNNCVCIEIIVKHLN